MRPACLDDGMLLIIGALAIPVFIQAYSYTGAGKAVLVKPSVVITAVKNGDLPSYDYSSILFRFIDPGYRDESS